MQNIIHYGQASDENVKIVVSAIMNGDQDLSHFTIQDGNIFISPMLWEVLNDN